MKHHSPERPASAVFFDKLETIIELLQVMIGMPPSSMLIDQFPGLGGLFKNGGAGIAHTAKANKALEIMFAASLPSAPENVQTYTVGTMEVLLASNMSMPLMRVTVTNLNVAQPLLISKKGVVLSAGGLILARQTESYTLPIGANLYGIVALGTILVTVAIGYDIQPRIAALVEGGKV